MKSVTTCCFLSSLFFSFADAKCGESSATPSNIISQSEDKFRIDASKFCESRGARIEDSDQGQYVGFLDPNDWIAYDIELPSAGSYQITYSVASLQGKGSFQLEKLGGSAVYGIVSTVPTTGSWYAFENVAHTVQLPKGKQAIALAIQEGDFNIDWIELKRLASDSKETPVPSSVDAPVSSPIAEQPSAAPAVVVKTPTPIPVTSPMPVPVAAPIKTPRAAVPSTGSGFVRAIDKRIVDGKGNNLILRGQGLGGWMLQEPYQMLTVEAAPKGQWQMFQKIEETVGRAGLEQYRQAWLDNWCTQEDVKEFKASGFNSIRVALHYNLFTLPIEQEPVRGQDTWIQDGFDRLDLLLDWCQMEEIYLILDLHAAPGGQGANSAINDYDDSKPSMWEDEENVRKSIALWVKWAAKYKDNTWIAGYDLLNEPNWGFEPGHPNGCSDQKNIPLKRFYDHAIAAIRKVDTNHIIYINGNCWGNNHKGIWPFADDNVALSFHRYWIENTDASIQNFLDMRDDYNVPIWMGESGENDNIWYKEAVQLLERHNIGWVSSKEFAYGRKHQTSLTSLLINKGVVDVEKVTVVIRFLLDIPT